MKISLIVAMTTDRIIGKDGGLPWHLSPDLRRFKRLTMGHALVMGRKTYESIGRPLPGRSMIVITRQPDYAPEGVQVVHSVEEALRLAREAGDEEAFIAGGAEIFQQTLGMADRIHLTQIEANFPGDTRFPEIDPAEWRLVEEERHEAGDEAPFPYVFQVLDREKAT